MAKKTAITPTRAENYPEWYQQVVKLGELAEPAVARGCMVIKPWGFGLWDNIKNALDKMIKDTGHENFYCPLFVPLSLMEKEAEHVSGFAKECAVVTHHRLEEKDGKLEPAAPLEEPFIIRPTSEAIIGEVYSRWVQSYRDLPLLLNQWANVVRWEMRTRLFLRTSEFLWQEGHTVHADADEAMAETLKMLEVYRVLCEDYLAVPVICGEKTEGEKFPGAENTFTIEAMTQDGKALQNGTSHYFGQKFSKAFNIKFLNKEGVDTFAWTTSWGVTTRLIGSLVMTHSDDDGLVLPPKIAPSQVVILPLVKNDGDKQKILSYCDELIKELQALDIRVRIDASDKRPGEKSWHWVKKGVPVRVEVGMQEVAGNTVCVSYRHKDYKDKAKVSKNEFVQQVVTSLDTMQQELLQRAQKFREDNTVTIKTKEEFYAYFKEKSPGFARIYWHSEPNIEQQLKTDLKVSPRCIPLAEQNERGNCIFSGVEAPLTIFARAY